MGVMHKDQSTLNLVLGMKTAYIFTNHIVADGTFYSSHMLLEMLIAYPWPYFDGLSSD